MEMCILFSWLERKKSSYSRCVFFKCVFPLFLFDFVWFPADYFQRDGYTILFCWLRGKSQGPDQSHHTCGAFFSKCVFPLFLFNFVWFPAGYFHRDCWRTFCWLEGRKSILRWRLSYSWCIVLLVYFPPFLVGFCVILCWFFPSRWIEMFILLTWRKKIKA